MSGTEDDYIPSHVMNEPQVVWQRWIAALRTAA
jgi:hypothetical protein